MKLLINILYALPVYQAFTLMLLLLLRWFGNGGKHLFLMAVFQFLATIYFLFNFLYAVQNFSAISVIYPFVLPIILLFAPLFYIFLEAVSTPGFTFKSKHLFHALPAFVYLTANAPFIFSGNELKLSYVSQNPAETANQTLSAYFSLVYISGIYIVLNFQVVFYFIKSVRIFRKHQDYIDNHYSYTENLSLGWFKVIAFSFFFFLVANQLLYFSSIGSSYFSPIIYNISMLLITLLVAYYSLTQKELKVMPVPSFLEHQQFDNQEIESLKGVNNNLSPESSVVEQEFVVIESSNPEKYAGSTLQEELKTKLVEGLIKLMEEEKIFRNPSLSLDDVAMKLNTNTKYISQAINVHFGKNFYHFINYYRIEEAKRLMINNENLKYSIYGIAQMVGFGSKSSFNTAFKRFSGTTPSDFISGIQKK
ncbi:MAG: helix-turn-helix domain-containing protein [Lentimicrobium sp.]|nr:helix-turn-helix domain-containing protein [Lentimicrobium sp.]